MYEALGGTDLSRKALESARNRGISRKKFSQFHFGQLLGLSRTEAEDLLAHHADLYDYNPAELSCNAACFELLSSAKSRK